MYYYKFKEAYSEQVISLYYAGLIHCVTHIFLEN